MLPLSDQDQSYLIRIRRELHQIPELGYQEHQTSALIQRELASFGLEVQTGFAGTGVIGILRGGADSPVIGLRADMDALPITEQTGADFASQHAGVMHACGHDTHMAMLLTAAKILSARRGCLNATFKFIFQPAEEMLGGGKKLIEDGALKNPDVDYAFGIHVWPDLPAGTFGLKHGALLASMDAFELTLKGMSGHGAAPHQGIDAVVGGAHLITALQTVVSRETDPLDAAVISIGTLTAGQGANITAETAVLRGHIRTLAAATREQTLAAFERTVAGICQTFRLQYELNYTAAFPVTENHAACVDFARDTLSETFGADKVRLLDKPSMASEDFAYYLQKVAGTFLFLGVNDGAGGAYKLHHECFLPSEQALTHGVAAWLALAENAAALPPKCQAA